MTAEPQMQEEPNTGVILATTAEAIALAKELIRTARYGTVATLEPGTDWPRASRVGVGTDIDGSPVILISRLAPHTGALLADPRCSVLLGEPGKGDPLAHPRVSVHGEAIEIPRGSADEQRLDARYLSLQPKAKLYSGLGDFRYFKITPRSVSLNAGFGRAYNLKAEDILSLSPANGELAETEPSAIAHMNDDHSEAVGLYAEHFAKAAPGKWRLAQVDAEGLQIVDGDEVRRIVFDTPLTSAKDMHMMLVRMAGEARRALDRPLKDARLSS